jgi:hypothetical protein
MTLADPEQILGLSPYSRDVARSWDAAKAGKFPRLSGEAEDVLVLNPDIVVAGRFTKRATRELLKEKGLRVAEFDAARSLEDVKKQIRAISYSTQSVPLRKFSGWTQRSHIHARLCPADLIACWRCRGAAGFPAAIA